MKLKKIALSLSLSLLGLTNAHAAINNDTVKIGFITDMSGVYADIDGKAGIEAIKLAIADMGGSVNGKKIELVYADHQNKTDIASSKAREWFDQKNVDMIIGGTNSATAIAVAKVAAEKKKPFIAIGAGSSALTNAECTPYTIHYAYNTRALANVTGSELIKEGNDSWFFVTADYAFGHALQGDAAALVTKAGGKIKGNVQVPLGSTDFSSFMLQAQSSGAKVLGLANAGGDFINSMKAASEFGVTATMKPVGLLVFINDIHALGLETTKGLYLTAPWYWNQDDASREWAKRFDEKVGRKPSFLQAGDYSAAMTYLQAVKTTDSDDGATIMKYLKSHTINNFFMKDTKVREDGLVAHDMFLMQVKTPEESKGPWDYYKVIKRVSGDTAYGPESASTCKVQAL